MEKKTYAEVIVINVSFSLKQILLQDKAGLLLCKDQE